MKRLTLWSMIMTLMIASAIANASSFELDARSSASAALIGKLAVGDRLSLTISDSVSFSLSVVSCGAGFADCSTCIAAIDGSDSDKAVIVQSGSCLQIDFADSRTHRHYAVSSSEKGVEVSASDETAKPCACGGTLLPPERKVVAPATSRFKGAMKAMTTASGSEPSPAETNVYIDLLVAYDTDAAKWVKNEWSSSSRNKLEEFALMQVEKINLALSSTDLDDYFTCRLVGVQEIGKSAGGNLYTALENITNDTWRVVKEKRDEVEADIVCMLVDNGDTTGYTGLGFSLNSYNYPFFSEYAYNACQVRAVANGHTMTHEVGHNLGAGHPDKLKDSPGPQYYAFSSGYYFTGTNDVKYFTIMGYNNDGYDHETLYEQAPYFSSPQYDYEGTTVGTETNDNTLTLWLNYKTVAKYRGGVSADDVGEAIDAPNFDWETSEYFPWSVYFTNGVDCARSCEMSYNSTSWLRAYMEGPAQLKFRYMLTSPGGIFTVKCGNETLFTRSEDLAWDLAWTNQTVSLPAGTNLVTFSYTHNSQSYEEVWCNGVVLDAVSVLAKTIDCRVGVNCSVDTGLIGYTVKNLPKGLKYDKKTGIISGVPTVATSGKALVTFTKRGEATEELAVGVAALPTGAAGTFNGFVVSNVDDDINIGSLQATITEVGKITAKVITASGTYSFSGTGWGSVEDDTYSVELKTKKGESLFMSLDSNAAWNEYQLNGTFTASGATESAKAQKNAFGKSWYFAAEGDEENGWKLSYAENAKSAALTVSLNADGKTTVSGKLGTVKVSSSSYADVSGITNGAIYADFTPVISMKIDKKSVKKVLSLRTKLWFDRSDEHEGGAGSAVWAD